MAEIKDIHLGKIGDIHSKMNIPNLNQCYPGMEPTEYNLVIAPGELSKTVGRLGLILLADDAKDQLGMAVQVGRIVAASPLAFNFANWGEKYPPQVGDIVWFARFAGGVFDGIDGREYRLIKDKDITGIIPAVDLERLEQIKAMNEISENKAA